MADVFDVPTTAAGIRPEPKRDRWGRYVLPDPVGGKEIAWTRATTYASTVADTYGLTQWQMRMVAKGIATRPDLYALAAATPVDDKKVFDRVVNDAKEAAAASSGANLGTALHAFTERVDLGEKVDVPTPWKADIDAYRNTMAAEKVGVTADWIERITVVRQLQVAGTFDRILTMPDGLLRIGDVKTGKDLSYSWGEIAIQLALYAHGAAIWDDRTATWEPMPDLDKQVGVVIWLPVGRGHCELFEVDLAAGWEMARTCGVVREWRKRKDLARPLNGTSMPVTLSASTRSTPRSTPKPDNRTGSAGLHLLIKKAGSIDALTQLWAEADAVGAWLPAHTEAAKARKDVLSSTGQANQ